MNQDSASSETEGSSPTSEHPALQTATSARLFEMAAADLLSKDALLAGLRFIQDIPNRHEWRRFLDILLLVIGAGFLVSGIFFFFAYNWNDLHDFAKLGIVQGTIIIAAAFAHYLGLDRLSGKISLTVAALLVGALLALFGQIYQSTADAYTLFLYWALYIVGWVIISRFAPLWMVLMGLLNLGLIFFWEQAGIQYEDRFIAESLFALNGVSLLLWEWFRNRQTEWIDVSWMQNRLWPGILAAATFIPITISTIGNIMDINASDISRQTWLIFITYPLFIAATWYYYRARNRDLFILTMMCLSVIGIVTTLVARLLDFNETIMFFVLAAVVIVQAGFAALWLRNLGEEA